MVIIRFRSDEFRLPADVLRVVSSRLAFELRDSWRNTTEPALTISSHDHILFAVETFVDWCSHRCTGNEFQVDPKFADYTQLAKAYIFAQDYQVKEFQNDIMDILAVKLSFGHDIEVTLPKLIYDRTPPRSPIRKLLLDYYAHAGRPSRIMPAEAFANLPKEFLRDLVCALYLLPADDHTRDRVTDFTPAMSGCRYHDHGPDHQYTCTELKFTLINPATSSRQVPTVEEANEDDEDLDSIPPHPSHPQVETTNINAGVERRSATPTPESSFIQQLRRRRQELPELPVSSSSSHETPAPVARMQATPTPRRFHDSGIAMSEKFTTPTIKTEDPETPCPPTKKRKVDGLGAGAGKSRRSAAVGRSIGERSALRPASPSASRSKDFNLGGQPVIELD